MNKRPNAIIIGAGKAGSTSLHNHLSRHPSAFGSRDKELMYFSSRFNKGEDWYLSNFPEDVEARIYFESTPQYSFRDEFPHVAQRICEFNPDMRILYIIREPISRIVSHFNHWHSVNPEKYTDLSNTLAIPENRRYFIDRTRYFYQLQAYLKVFSTNQIKIIFLEDLKSDLAATMDSIFRFLDIEELGSSIPQKAYNKGSRFSGTQMTRSDIPESQIKEITAYLADDVQQILAFSAKPADFWGSGYLMKL